MREVLRRDGRARNDHREARRHQYWFYSSRLKHSKIVHFYLMRYLKGALVPQEGEVEEVAWVPLAEMAKR